MAREPSGRKAGEAQREMMRSMTSHGNSRSGLGLVARQSPSRSAVGPRQSPRLVQASAAAAVSSGKPVREKYKKIRKIS